MELLTVWERGGEGTCSRVVEDVGECLVYWLGRQWPRRKQLMYSCIV